jgi:putative nucleotidyltransferase with HDIG domain
MDIDSTFLRSRLARRVFLLFVCCAVLPIGALFIQSYGQVTSQLHDQSYRRLQQMSKALGMASYERLLLVDSQMRMIASDMEEEGSAKIEAKSISMSRDIKEWFSSLYLVADDGNRIVLYGKPGKPVNLSSEQKAILDSGRTAIVTQPVDDAASEVLMLREVEDKNSKARLLVGEINSAYLWGVGPDNTLPPMTELCVLDESGNLIISSVPLKESKIVRVASTGNSSTSRQFRWKYKGRDYLASYWTLFLRAGFNAPNWTVVLSQSSDEVLAPMAYFRQIYPLLTLLCLLIVLLLSMVCIRRTLDPLKTLKDGTLQISEGDFSHHVDISTGDELEELAASFNAMSSRLGRQFNALTTIAELDRAILSSMESRRIVDVMLGSMRDFFRCDFALICLLDGDAPGRSDAFVQRGRNISEGGVSEVEIASEDIATLKDNRRYMLIGTEKNPLGYLSSFYGNGVKSFLILPVWLKDELLAVVNMGYCSADPVANEDVEHARQLADQMAIGLSNSKLVRELEQLNWGALQALARTVDAKSSWTAGHSERVTNLALEIAECMGLPQKQLDNLHRAGLLHDIGKIGTPHFILDKAGPLTSEEYGIIKEHPVTGARILDPISAYRDIIPIVSQHHERFDGRGYPRGLAGEAIILEARILAVADVFDALISERPYREGWNLDRVVEHMREQAGLQFDPSIIEVFLEKLAQKEARNLIGARAFPYRVNG